MASSRPSAQARHLTVVSTDPEAPHLEVLDEIRDTVPSIPEQAPEVDIEVQMTALRQKVEASRLGEGEDVVINWTFYDQRILYMVGTKPNRHGEIVLQFLTLDKRPDGLSTVTITPERLLKMVVDAK